jgi:hypothetical protein
LKSALSAYAAFQLQIGGPPPKTPSPKMVVKQKRTNY